MQGSRLAGDGLKCAVFIQFTRVIVNDHRWLATDSVEKVCHGFHGRKVRARDWNLYFEQGIPGSDFTSLRANKAFSAVSTRAAWKDRLFQYNQSKI